MKRKPNTQECGYHGRRMSCLRTDIEASVGYVLIGSENDDEIYFDKNLGDDQELIKERVKIIHLYEPVSNDGFNSKIDLEDVLKFAVKNCGGIYRRVLKEFEVENAKKEK